jgi:hypothetical protein
VPEIPTSLIATLVCLQDGAWAALLADGRSYKANGDVGDILWWALKLCRFETGELDRHDRSIKPLASGESIL